MKKILLFLLAAVMVLSLAACGENNSTPSGDTGNTSGNEPSAPPDGWATEYTILIGGSDEWTPFAGKSGVTFASSDDKVIDVSDDGTTVEFTGKKGGEAVITAIFDGPESKAIVRVRAAQAETDQNVDPIGWPDPPLTVFTPEPDFDYVIKDLHEGTATTWLLAEFPNATLEQIQSYGGIVIGNAEDEDDFQYTTKPGPSPWTNDGWTFAFIVDYDGHTYDIALTWHEDMEEPSVLYIESSPE
jgi:hypothetical protein